MLMREVDLKNRWLLSLLFLEKVLRSMYCIGGLTPELDAQLRDDRL